MTNEPYVNALSFSGIDPTGINDSTIGIQSALNASIGKKLVFPPGTFNISKGLTASGNINIEGQGRFTTIHSSDLNHSVLFISDADGGQVENIRLTGSASTLNGSGNGLEMTLCSRMLIDRVFVEGVGGQGIKGNNLTQSQITNCDVRNNFSDGIHIGHQSKDVYVAGNNTYNSGDDAIAVVSLIADGGMCERIIVSGNRVTNSRADGLKVAGGKDVTFMGNTVNGTSSCGIIVETDTTFKTLPSINTIVKDNNVTNVGSVQPNRGNLFGISVDGQNTIAEGNIVHDFPNRGLQISGSRNTVRGNIIDSCTDSQADNQVGMILEGNTFSNCMEYGFYSATTSRDCIITDNVFINNNTKKANDIGDAYFQNHTNLLVKNNASIDNRSSTQIQYTFKFDGCKNLVFSDNIEDAGTVTHYIS